MCLMFEYKINEYCFIVLLLPTCEQNSPYGWDSNVFNSSIRFGRFTSIRWLLFCLRRTKQSHWWKNIIASVGDMPKSGVIDTAQSKQGDAFLDFLMEARMAVLNRRVGDHNDLTSVSPKGKSVTDYIAVPHGNIIEANHRIMLLAR